MPPVKLTLQSIVSRAKDILFSQFDEEFLAIDPQAGFIYSLNETASLVWELIAEPVSVDAVCNQLQEGFTVDAETCQKDIIELLSGLLNASLVKVHHEPLG